MAKQTRVSINRSSGVSVSINDIETYEAYVQERIAKREAELEEKHQATLAASEETKAALAGQIALLQQQNETDRARLRDAEASFREFREKIAELERLLEEATDATTAIGANRIAAAQDAALKGDYAEADAIFAEVEKLEAQAVNRAADAAFGRGLIAEEQVRWGDAARHYARAAKLNETFETLFKAGEFAWRAGDFKAAFRFGEDLLALARADGTQEQLATALNNLASVVQAQGRYAEAETLYRQALKIDKAIGEGHPHYAAALGNLALVVRAQGRYPEAEALYRQALEIGKATIGEGHPSYAIRLNNLAGVVEAQGRYPEAEALYRQALEIGKATIGEAHPDYATHLGNLAGVVQAQGRYPEAEGLHRQALEIDAPTIGEAHPSYATALGNLAGVVEAQGRYPEAEALNRQALELLERSLGPDHPNTKAVRKNLETFLAAHPPD